MLTCSPAKPRVTRVWVGPFPEPFQTDRDFFYTHDNRNMLADENFPPPPALGPAITWRQLEVLEALEVLETPAYRLT